MKKILFTLVLCFTVSATLFAQSDKLKEKATQKVEELNSEIIAGDEALALSEEQKAQIYEIHIERIKAVRKAKKGGSDKDALKALNKTYFQKIYKEVLSKEQLKARKLGNKKAKKG